MSNNYMYDGQVEINIRLYHTALESKINVLWKKSSKVFQELKHEH